MFKNYYGKDVDRFENFLLGKGEKISGIQMFEELVEFFDVKGVDVDKSKYFQNERFDKQNNILSEGFLGSVGDFIAGQIGDFLGGAFLGVAKSSLGILLAIYLGYKTKMHEKIPSFITNMYNKYKDKKAAESALINSFAKNKTLIDITKTILSQLVAITIHYYFDDKYGADIGKLGKQDYKDIGVETGTEEAAKKVEEEVKEEAEESAIKQAQSLLFTKSYKDSANKAAGRDLTDDELLQDYEAKLNDIVMSFRQTELADEASEVEAERSQLAYNNELNKKDAGVIVGVGSLPATIGLATLGIATGGIAPLAVGVIGSLFAGLGAEAISKARAQKQGPKEREYLASSEKDKVAIRNIIIDLAKKELNIKESHGLSDKYIYLAGLSLLFENLNEEEVEEAEASEEKTEETDDLSKIDIRGKIDWTTISRKLTSGNFFLFNPTYTRRVGKQAAAEVQYDFGSHLAALTEDCFGLQITDVDKLDIRQAQAMSVTQMMVNQNAAMGQGSFPYARTKGMGGKGKNDPIGIDEFAHLLNQSDGDTAKVILYLMMNGRLDSFLKLLQGGQNTPESVFDFLGKVLEGEDLPKSMEASKQQAIENINSTEWITNLLKFGKIDSPITVIYGETIGNDELEILVNDIEEKMVAFSKNFDSEEAKKARPKYTAEKHGCFISKSKSVSGVDTSDFYYFNAETVGVRKIIDKYGRFISSKKDESTQDNITIKVNVSGFSQIFTDFTFNPQGEFNDLYNSLTSKLAVLFIAREMFSNQPGPYHRKISISNKNELVDRRQYMIDAMQTFGLGEVIQSKAEEGEDKDAVKQQNIAAFQREFIKERASSFYEDHLDLYRLWQVR